MAGRYAPAAPNTGITGVVPGTTQFAARFFNMSRAEAVQTDPQHRLFLEDCWYALQSAGYHRPVALGRVGVFAACGENRYERMDPGEPERVGVRETELAAHMARERDYLASRVSFALGLTGPSLSVSTACSGSLVAVVLACRAILAGECDAALAGGELSLLMPEYQGYERQEGGILSATGECHPFEERANGTVPGSKPMRSGSA